MKIYFKIFFLILFSSLIVMPLNAAPKDAPKEGEFLQFLPPTDCFGTWFGPQATAVGQPSCAKKLVRFQLDNISQNLQQAASILESAKDAAKRGGWDMPAGTEVDLTTAMQVEAEKHATEDKARFGDKGMTFTVTKALLSRGADQTIEGLVYEVWRFHGAMSTTASGRTMEDVISIKIALNVGETNTTRILDQTMSFGGGGNNIQGVIVTKTADGTPVSLNLNFEMKDEGGSEIFECTDVKNPEKCQDKFSHSFEQTIALKQTFDSDGNDAGNLLWTDSANGGGGAQSPDDMFKAVGGPPQGPPVLGFNNTNNGAWDITGAGCLEMKQDLDSKFKADSNHIGTGGGYCGPFVDGTKKCEACKNGRDYSATLKVEDAQNLMFKDCQNGICLTNGTGTIQQGDVVPPEFAALRGGPPSTQGFQCDNPAVTNNCNGYCPDGSIPPPPDPLVADNNTEGQAWFLCCKEGLMFDDTGIQGGFGGGKTRKGECWDKAGSVVTTSNDYSFAARDARIDSTFNVRVNFDDKKAINFEKPAAHCEMYFDDDRNVEVITSTGKDFCVPDFHSSNNTATAGTPLCSAAGPPSC